MEVQEDATLLRRTRRDRDRDDREGGRSFSVQLQNHNDRENRKKSSRRPSQQVLVDMHQRPTLVQCTAGQCWLSGRRSQTCRVGLEASTPCLDPSLAPSLYPSIPPALSLSTLQPSQAQSVSARSPKLVPLMSEMEQMTRGRVWRGPPPKPLLGNKKKQLKKKIPKNAVSLWL